MKIGCRQRAILIYKIITASSDSKSLRDITNTTTISKSSVHRQRTTQQARINHIGHDLFETEIGWQWLERMFYAVVFIFGVQAGVGAETISLFLKTILVDTYLATSPGS